MNRVRAWLGVVASLLLLAGIVLAQEATAEIYPRVRKATNARAVPTATGSATSGGASKTFSSSPADPAFTGGAPTIVVAPRFSVASATAEVHVGLYWYEGTTYTFTGIAYVFTMTAAASGGDGTLYSASNPLTGILDSLGADAYDVRYVAVSSGTATPYAWTAGAGGRAAE